MFLMVCFCLFLAPGNEQRRITRSFHGQVVRHGIFTVLRKRNARHTYLGSRKKRWGGRGGQKQIGSILIAACRRTMGVERVIEVDHLEAFDQPIVLKLRIEANTTFATKPRQNSSFKTHIMTTNQYGKGQSALRTQGACAALLPRHGRFCSGNRHRAM